MRRPNTKPGHQGAGPLGRPPFPRFHGEAGRIHGIHIVHSCDGISHAAVAEVANSNSSDGPVHHTKTMIATNRTKVHQTSIPKLPPTAAPTQTQEKMSGGA